MSRRMLMAAILAAALVCAGCGATTTIQKGSAVGAGAGAATGATVGHYLTSLGGAKGALLGLAAGAATGALAADAYYGMDSEELLASEAESEVLAAELEARQAEVAELRKDLQNETSQRQALLEVVEKQREEMANLADLADRPPAEPAPAPEIKITLLSEVLFPSGKAKLTSEGKGVLAEAADTIRRQHPDSTIEVRGHTDNVPIRYSGFKSNLELSCARALAVLQCLVEEEGFDKDRVSITGFGESRPVASNDTPEGRRQNRRAEIVVRPETVQVAAREPE